jgi:hypothetical protein
MGETEQAGHTGGTKRLVGAAPNESINKKEESHG